MALTSIWLRSSASLPSSLSTDSFLGRSIFTSSTGATSIAGGWSGVSACVLAELLV